MASTSAASQSTVLNEINALFSWNPPLLKLSAPQSKLTRKLSFFDQHFSPQLVLKRVVPLRSLVQDLANTVDLALEEAKDTLPALSDENFITTGVRKVLLKKTTSSMTKEITVATFYEKTTGLFCPYVASTLALHPTASFSEWESLLH